MPENQKSVIPMALQNDLATVSCYAAIELDCLQRSVPSDFKFTQLLIGLIKEATEKPYGTRLSSAMALTKAFEEIRLTSFNRKLQTFDELSKEANSLTEQLIEVSRIPSSIKNETITKLKELLIALSGNLRGYEEPIELVDETLQPS